MSINQTIRSRRHALGLSISELARRCGVTRSAVQHWERDDGLAPNRSHQAVVAQVLGMTVGQMMESDRPHEAPLSARALEVARLYDSITDPRQRRIAYAYMVAQSGAQHVLSAIPRLRRAEDALITTEAGMPAPAPRPLPAHTR